MLISFNRIFPGIFLLWIVWLTIQGGDAHGQDCTVKKRKYANRQEFYGQALLGLLLPGTIDNGDNAVDGNVKSYATLSVDVGVLNQSQATQYLEFTTGANYIPANTPVTIKMSLPTSILGVLDNVRIQPFKNLNYYAGGLFGVGARWRADEVGTSFTGAALVNLVNGVGELEFTVTPSEKYQGVWINIGSVVGLGVTAKIYHAYVHENETAIISCNNNIDVLSGVKAGLVGGVLDATSSIVNPDNAIDIYPLTSYAELNAGVNLVGEVFHTTVFNTQAKAGDVVKIILEKPGGGLLNLGIISGFKIQLYNGSTPAGDPITSTSTGLLSLNLLPGTTTAETKRELYVQVPVSYGVYDRVQIKIGGVATVGLEPGLRIYDVKRIILPQPSIDGIAADSKIICAGNSVSLSVNEVQDCTTYKWYKTSAGGSSVHTGTTAYTPATSSLLVGDNLFYVEASRTNCTEKSERIPVTITVNPLPSISLGGDISVCQSVDNCELTYTLGEGNPTKYSISWSTADLDDITETNFTASPIKIPIPQNTPAGTYPATMNITNADGCSKSVPFNLIIHPKPNQAVITAQ